MRLKDFAEEVVKMISERVDGEVQARQVTKNNGLVLTGILIKPFSSNEYAAPTIYVDNLYNAYMENKITIKEAVERVLNIYNKSIQNSSNLAVDAKQISNWDWAKERLIFQIINAENNKELLDRLPHKMWDDLAIIFNVVINKEMDGFASTKVTDQLLKTWKVDENKVYSIAMENTPNILPYSLQTIGQTLANMNMPSDIDITEVDAAVPMYILTNKKKVNGAGTILYPNILKDFADAINGDFYILPSSIHEVILVPSNAVNETDQDVNDLKNMVCEINRTQVAAEEVLSDSVYKYCKDNGQVIIM